MGDATLKRMTLSGKEEKGEYQSNNLIVGGVLYTATPSRRVIALDAATGRERWVWDPAQTIAGTGGRRQRGLVFWQNASGGERDDLIHCARRSPPARDARAGAH